MSNDKQGDPFVAIVGVSIGMAAGGILASVFNKLMPGYFIASLFIFFVVTILGGFITCFLSGRSDSNNQG